jgi:serine phosphatase RsbU (regulator of sigma subunit)/PAS domain-containing protein
MVGSAGPVGVAAALELTTDPLALRPGVVLLTAVVALAVLFGRRCGAAAAAVSTLLVWWEFTRPRFSLRLATVEQGLALALFVVGAGSVVLLSTRLERALRAERTERSLYSSLVAQAPVGIALFDPQLLFVMVNAPFAAISGRDVEAHLGRRPAELDAQVGGLVETTLTQVVASNAPTLGLALVTEDPQTGAPRHLRADFYPVRTPDATVVGVTALVQDVTADVVSGERNRLLGALAQTLAAASDLDEIADAVCGFLADAFSCRSAIGFVDGVGAPDDAGEHGRDGSLAADPAAITLHPSMRGYPAEVTATWSGTSIPLTDRTPIAECARSGRRIEITDLADLAARYPAEVVRSIDASGDQGCVWVPVVDPLDPQRVLAVFRLGWPRYRRLTDASRALHGVLASLIALAVNRVRLTEASNRDRFRHAMDAMLDQVVIAHAVRDEDDRIADFEIDYANERSSDGAGRSADQLVGRRVCELYPGWRASGMFDRFSRVVETGEPLRLERHAYRDRTPGGTPIVGYWNLQAARLDDGYIAASRDITSLVEAERVARAATEIADRHRVAVQILQRAALPATLPRLAGLQLAAHHQPAARDQPIGGDWYDAFALSTTRVALVIADVAGHGPDAATTMLHARSVLRAVAAAVQEPADQEPADVLRAVNEILHDPVSPDAEFITCCYCVLDLAADTMSWASAGHPPPLVISTAGAAGYPDTDSGPPLGVDPTCYYRTHSASLLPGDRLVLFTDGLVERPGEPITVGMERLRANAQERRILSAEELATTLAAVQQATYDDVALLVAQRTSVTP